ncbi:uncharacterized protein LOC108044717 [Drosophila rhopaloa]|uniref:GOLD domain-containing protein n=1 Tax=Drosophila rhopaloa TaxID=1041015 RepID=A0ABM5HES6_DRORH|nr:uncharacterized protein LOC108044717 [Drosophila rhopaloa]
MEKRLLSLVLVLSILHSSCGRFLLIREKEQKCITQTRLDVDTDVIVEYKVEYFSSGGLISLSPGIGMDVVVRDSNGTVILSRTYSSEASFRFTTYRPGDYQICMNTNGSAAGALLNLYVDIKTDERTKYYERNLSAEYLENMQVIVRIPNELDGLYSEMIFVGIALVVVSIFFMIVAYRILFGKNYLYLAYCKALSEEELARFRTPEAYRALMSILGPKGQGLTTSAISKWVSQLQDPESTNEKEQLRISEKIQSRVEEFAEKFLKKPALAVPENPKGSYYAANVQLTNLLVHNEIAGHLKGDTFLLVCDCKDCKANDPNEVDTEA